MVRDKADLSLADALRGAGVDPAGLGRDDEALARIGAFVELHVEQGRYLVDEGVPLAVPDVAFPSAATASSSVPPSVSRASCRSS